MYLWSISSKTTTARSSSSARSCGTSSTGVSSRRSDAGLSPAQHQLLLAVRGHPDAKGPTVNEVAEHLVLRQNSAVELIDRAEAAGYVSRVPDPADRRIVHIRLTPAARGRLTRLAKAHLEELRRLGPRIHGLVAGLDA